MHPCLSWMIFPIQYTSTPCTHAKIKASNHNHQKPLSRFSLSKGTNLASKQELKKQRDTALRAPNRFLATTPAEISAYTALIPTLQTCATSPPRFLTYVGALALPPKDRPRLPKFQFIQWCCHGQRTRLTWTSMRCIIWTGIRSSRSWDCTTILALL